MSSGIPLTGRESKALCTMVYDHEMLGRCWVLGAGYISNDIAWGLVSCAVTISTSYLQYADGD